MPTDLEAAVRDALRADKLTADDLRRPAFAPRAAGGRRPMLLAVAASVVAVLVAAGVLAGLRGSPSPDRSPAAGGPTVTAPLLGYRWALVSLTDDRGSLAVPASLKASLGYTRDQYVLGNDSVNALQGRITPTRTGYSVRDAASTAVAGVGDPTRDRVTAAIDATFFTLATSTAATPPPPQVSVRVDGTTLTLTVSGRTLTLTRAGAQPEVGAASPSGTASS